MRRPTPKDAASAAATEGSALRKLDRPRLWAQKAATSRLSPAEDSAYYRRGSALYVAWQPFTGDGWEAMRAVADSTAGPGR